MDVQDIKEKLAPFREELRNLGVASLAVFGSVVRGEAKSDSDIDMLIEFDPSYEEDIGLFHFFRVQHRLEEILGVEKVDLVERCAIRQIFRERILAEAVEIG